MLTLPRCLCLPASTRAATTAPASSLPAGEHAHHHHKDHHHHHSHDADGHKHDDCAACKHEGALLPCQGGLLRALGALGARAGVVLRLWPARRAQGGAAIAMLRTVCQSAAPKCPQPPMCRPVTRPRAPPPPPPPSQEAGAAGAPRMAHHKPPPAGAGAAQRAERAESATASSTACMLAQAQSRRACHAAPAQLSPHPSHAPTPHCNPALQCRRRPQPPSGLASRALCTRGGAPSTRSGARGGPTGACLGGWGHCLQPACQGLAPGGLGPGSAGFPQHVCPIHTCAWL